jgi:hypothetical protein
VEARSLIKIPIPEEVFEIYIGNIVPIKLLKGDKNLKGELHINKITDLNIKKDRVTFNLHITGSNLLYLKEQKKSYIKIDIKKILIELHVDAILKFDIAKKILIIKPRLTKKIVKSDSKRIDSHILQIISIINNKEYPVKARDIEPVINDILNNQINLKIVNLYAKKRIIYVEMNFNIGGLLE